MNTYRTLGRLVLGACLAGAALGVHAKSTEAQEQLDSLRQLPYKGKWPSLTGFSPAQPVKGLEAPPGKHAQTQAYRSSNGCVAFFLPLGPDVADVALKWNGPACTGKALNGKGELQIRRRVGEGTAVAVLNGEFKDGMLTGDAIKAYFSFDRNKQPVPGVHVFMGEFANSVLHGSGKARWSGAPDARPSLWYREGTFKDGALQGGGTLARLRPRPGVEAEIQPLLFNEEGEIYIEQARLNSGKLIKGTLYFENDPVPWRVELATWRDDGPEQARLQRLDLSQSVALNMACPRWRFEETRLLCDKGLASNGGMAGQIAIANSGFSVALPVRAERGLPFVPTGTPEEQYVILDHGSMPVKCDAGLRHCTGKGELPIGISGLYWKGDLEWRDGSVRPVRGTLYRQPNFDLFEKRPAFDPDGRDERLATCDAFDNPVRCDRGKVFQGNGGHFYGVWYLHGLAFEAEDSTPARYRIQEQMQIRRVGWGTLTFPEGRWAEVRIGPDDSIDDVGKCDDPNSTAEFRCEEMGGKGVRFIAKRSGSRQPVQQSAPEPVFRMPDTSRFEPTPVPQRPVYTLPGMR